MARVSTKSDGRPSFQFYPDDWLSDAALRLCPLAARGLWPDMLCIMWRSPRRGYLLKPNGSKFEANELAKLTGDTEQEIKQALAVLGENEVFSTDANGVIYSRRMVREAAISEARAEAGRKGGLFKTTSKGEANAKQNPRASSSSPTPTSEESPSPACAREALRPKRGKTVVNPSEASDLDLVAPTDRQLIMLRDLANAAGTTVEDAAAALGIPVVGVNVTRLSTYLRAKAEAAGAATGPPRRESHAEMVTRVNNETREKLKKRRAADATGSD